MTPQPIPPSLPPRRPPHRCRSADADRGAVDSRRGAGPMRRLHETKEDMDTMPSAGAARPEDFTAAAVRAIEAAPVAELPAIAAVLKRREQDANATLVRERLMRQYAERSLCRVIEFTSCNDGSDGVQYGPELSLQVPYAVRVSIHENTQEDHALHLLATVADVIREGALRNRRWDFLYPDDDDEIPY